jgi:hypothetical protein
MALDGSYDGLKASIADFLNRTDLAAVIPDFIRLAEAQMTRRFAGRQRQGLPVPRRLIQRADAEIDQGTEYIAAPSDFHGPIDFVLQSEPEIVLDYLDAANLQQQKQADRVRGAPRWYAIVGGELQLYPAADRNYTGEMTYIARVPALSVANPSNWILTDYPDAYLYGALVQSAPYLKDDARTTTWGALFTAALDDICNADPVPGEQSRLRSELSQLQRLGNCGAYDISTDNF